MKKVDLSYYPNKSVVQLMRNNKKFQSLLQKENAWKHVEEGLKTFVILTDEQIEALKEKYWN